VTGVQTCALPILGQYDRAITDYNKAIELNPQYAMAYQNRGSSYFKKGQYDLAIADFEMVLRISRDPNLVGDANISIEKINKLLSRQKQALLDNNQGAYNPRDRLYLAHIRFENAQPADTHMLFCDAIGNLSSSHIDKSLSDAINERLAYFRKQNKYCAMACFEVAPGRSITFGVEIDSEEGLTLHSIVEMFRRNQTVSKIPEILQKHIMQIFAKAYLSPTYLTREP
jgi:tetratricopeptide (TPR) repeat protein